MLAVKVSLNLLSNGADLESFIFFHLKDKRLALSINSQTGDFEVRLDRSDSIFNNYFIGNLRQVCLSLTIFIESKSLL